MQQLTLKHFILKQRVLDLYRYAIRSSRCNDSLAVLIFWLLIEIDSAIQDPLARKETMLFVRSEFERNRLISDVVRAPLPCVKLYSRLPSGFN
jgi:hypothetical protein